MKIAFLSRYQNRVDRGVESVVRELSERLSENHEVVILSGKESDSFQKIINGKFDIVVPFNGRTQSLKASVGRFFSRYKLVIGGHSGIGRDDIFNIVVAKPDIFVALTDHMANWAKKWAWGSKVIKINNGVDLKKFSPKGEKIKLDLSGPIILSVGALVWYKYHDKVIEAVSKLDKASLLIVGDGPDKERLQRLAEEKLPGRFRIEKFSYEDMPKVYRSCHVFTLPSWDREAFGVVYLEAMASGVPVVAPNDISRKEIVGDGGVLVNVNDLNSYVEAIDQALNTKWLNKPRKQAEKFSWERIVKEYEKVFIDEKK